MFLPQRRKGHRERYFIRIPEKGILKKLFVSEKSKPYFYRVPPSFPHWRGCYHSIFPPLRGKYYKKRLGVLCVWFIVVKLFNYIFIQP
jgi:hypothetical protein